jgi:small conductance mechanosensitive channel
VTGMDFMETVKKLIDSASEDIMHGIVRVIGALLLLIIGFKIIKWLCKKLRESKFSKKLDSSLSSFLNSFISITLHLLLVVVAVSVLGVPMATIVTVVGTAGLAIGLALQGSLSNFAGGFIIILFKPFSVGDYIEVGGYAGNVTDIGLFYTTLVSIDHSRISLPNSVVSSKELVNCSAVGTRVVNLEIGVSYESDVNKAEAILTDVAKNCEMSLKDREPIAFIKSYGESSIVINLRYWVKSQDYLTSQADVMDRIKEAFDINEIKFPFPQLDVHLDK